MKSLSHTVPQTPTQKIKSGFSTSSSQGIASSLVLFEMIFEVLVGRNLQNLHARFYFNDKSGNIKIALKVKMKIKLVSIVKMTSSSDRSLTANRHFLQRLGTKTPWQEVRLFAEQNLDLIPKTRKLAALKFALPRDFKYLITSDDDFFIENWPCLGNWWHLVSFRYLKYRILNLL